MKDCDQMGEHATHYVEKYFFNLLRLSLNWMNSGESSIVRYEELWRDPVTTLTRLTNRIQPVTQDRIESAIDLCDINLLRKLRDDPHGKFFRKGGPGSWRRELPDDIVDVFRHQEPYPSLFRALGYTLDPRDPLIDAPAKPRKSTNPFLEKGEFDNGIQVPVIVVKLYLLLDPTLKAQWSGNETATSSGSFFAWLNAPADKDSGRLEQTPVITNLAHYIYRARTDLQAAFPDPFGEDRRRFAHWFITHAQTEYALDRAFIEPVRSSMQTVSHTPSDKDSLLSAV
jgi:hypothetical protein